MSERDLQAELYQQHVDVAHDRAGAQGDLLRAEGDDEERTAEMADQALSLDDRRAAWRLDEILEAAIAAEDGQRPLYAYPRCEPLPAQQAIVQRAFECARAHGLHLPRSAFVVSWVDASPGVTRGLTVWGEGDTLQVWLNATQMPEDLAGTALHEAQHAADAISGLIRRVSRLELERRAVKFETQPTVKERRRWIMMGW